MKLNTIRDNKGARKQSMRVARGVGSGKGRTGGRGGKGQTARSGVAINGFEGGQMPIYRRLPKRGFNNPFKLRFAEVNIGTIQQAIDNKELDAAKEIDAIALAEAGIIKQMLDGVRLLGNGSLNAKITVRVVKASAGAKAAVEKAGGSVVEEPIKKTVLEKGKKTSKKEPAKKTVKSKK